MKRVSMSLALSMLLAGGALALPAAAQTNSQQDRMKACNTQAATEKLAGDARKSFMSTCLSGTAAATPVAQTPQERMKTCNTQASAQHMMGDDRKKFMSTCLKG
jgi:hypothetical protein